MILKEDSTEQKLRGAYYTPLKLAEKMVDFFKQDASIKSILEPSCGDGVFVDALVETQFLTQNRKVTAIEIEKNEAKKVAAKLKNNPNVSVVNRDFFEFYQKYKDINKYDLIRLWDGHDFLGAEFMADSIIRRANYVTLKTNCINKGELNPRYIDAFLDVLCLYCNNPSFDPDKYKVDFIKKDKILNLVPEEINDNCEKVINALDRALFFFQTRCGIRTIGEINYNLMLVLVGTLFMEDSYFYNYEVHRLLEAWYWSVVFSGEYDKDQNSHMISNLQNIVRCVSGTNRDLTWLNSISANVLKMTNFSDKDLLLMNKVNEDRYPKPVLRNFMCQYLLSGTYMDMFDETKKISVFCEDADTLEAHHIIPLGSAKKVGEITADIRKNPRHICNSPLNFVYITKAANKDISDDALDAYEKKIQPAAKAALFISSYTPASHDTEIKVRGLLESRYSMMQGTISGEINDLLTNWM